MEYYATGTKKEKLKTGDTVQKNILIPLGSTTRTAALAEAKRVAKRDNITLDGEVRPVRKKW